MKLPEEIKVAGFTYKVKYPYRFKETADLGQADYLQKEIRLTDVDKAGMKIPDDVVLEVFLHEVFHAVSYEYVNTNLKEDDIVLLSNGLYQVLKDNKLYFGE